MELLRATGLILRMHVAAVVRSRRALIGIFLAALPPLLAWLGLRFGPDELTPPRVVTAVSWFLNLQVVSVILSLVLGSAVVTEEIENRTITYVFTRPVSRAALFYGRWLATLVLVAALSAGSAAAVLWVAASGAGELSADLCVRVVASSLAAGAVYSLLFALLGVFLKRPMIVGLGYAFAFEALIANVPGTTQKLSIQYWLRSILVDPVASPEWERFKELGIALLAPTGEAVTTLAVVTVLALALGGVAIRRRQYVLSS